MSERKKLTKSSQGKSFGAKNIKHRKRGSIFQRFAIASLALGGLGQMIPLSAIAQLTPANTAIQNRATGSYTDPNNPGTPINTTSNTVTVTTSPVAGIGVTNLAFTDVNGGNVSPGDVLNYDFTVTNTGNYPEFLNLPAQGNIATQNFTITGYLADLNNDGTFETTIPAGAYVTPTTIPAGGSINVRVIGTVNAGALTGNPVSVSLGDIPPNDNSPATQNQADPIPAANDVRTSGNDPLGNAPVNGQREAAAFRTVPVGSSTQNLALATVLKTRASYVPNTPVTTDDQITYRLDMRVESTSPNTNFTPTSLTGTAISVNGATVTRVLVSDAIPAKTSFVAGTAIAPAGWTIVYTTSPTTTTPLAAAWTTTPPATPTRIGMVFTGNLAPGYTTATDPNGFQFTVVTSGAAAGDAVANIAQVFGQTLGDLTNRIVYDESGDQYPNNFLGGTTPPAPLGSLYDPVGDPTGAASGVANPAVQGTDNNNNNTGQNPAQGGGGTAATGGEDNVITINPGSTINNGPNGQPAAIGPTNNTDDFTNLSPTVPAGLNPTTTFDPNAVSFTNTLQNNGAGNLDKVKLVPLPPNDTSASNPSGRIATDIPDGTTVTISVPAVGANPAQTVTYTYTAAGGYTTAGVPIVLNGIGPNQTVSYTVSVDLPANTPLSSDRYNTLITGGATPTNAADRAGFPVLVVAFADNNNNGYDNDPIRNTTIDRVYTGYMNLLKESRILQGTGPAVTGANGTFSATNKSGAPGNIIEYRMSYINFSTPASAGSSGNGTLNANNFLIDDDGAAAPNTWASITTHNLGTTATQGTLQFFNGATSLGATDPASGIAVTRYQNNVGTVIPAGNGTFTFRRSVN